MEQADQNIQIKINPPLLKFGTFFYFFHCLHTKVLKMENFPDEVILKVLSYLDLKDLIFCGQLCKRIRAISYDESLWENINLHHQKVPAAFLEMILNNGCKYLNLHGAKLIGNLSLASKSTQLIYLDLSSTFNWDNDKAKEELLLSCHSLQKLSVKRIYVLEF